MKKFFYAGKVCINVLNGNQLRVWKIIGLHVNFAPGLKL